MRLTTVTFGLAFGLLASTAVVSGAFAVDTTKLPPKDEKFSFEGPFGTYDRGALQRGFQVYKEVCAACHAANHLAFHNLDEPGGPEFTEAQAKALAAAVKVPAEPNDKGETTDDKGAPLMRPATLADHFPSPFPNENAARANNGGALPPDLSMVVKVREGGPQYGYAILDGLHQKSRTGFTVTGNKYFNPYFEAGTSVCRRPGRQFGDLFRRHQGDLSRSPCVSHLLSWASEPRWKRKRMGFGVMVF